MTILKVFVIIGYFHLTRSQTRFMPNLPLGEYRTVLEKIYPCESSNYSHQFNVYLSKITLSTTELKGNITFLTPFDDNLTLDINCASWGLTGGWKTNAAVYITKKACSSFKNVLGNLWFSLVKGYNIPTSSCPLPAGTYITSGFDSKVFEDHNFPKIYFYGKYKVVIKLKNEANKIVGCAVLEMSLIRPWEKPI